MNSFVKTEKQAVWVQTIHDIAQSFQDCPEDVDALAQFPTRNIEALVQCNYSSISVPKKYGGEGLSVYDMVLFQETLASYDANTALSIGWNIGIAGDIFEKQLWNEEQLQFLSSELLHGALINRSVTEAQTGSPTRGGRPNTTAIKTVNGWRITGRKTFTTASPVLTYFLTSAWIEDLEQVGFFLIHKDHAGVSIDETWDMVSMRGTGSHDLVLSNVEVEEHALVELPTKSSGGKFNGWLLHIPACYLGVAQAARNYAIHFANHHSPNSLNGPIRQLPNVQQHIGEIELMLKQARYVLYGVAEAYDIKKSVDLANDISIAKHTVTNFALQIVDKAMRIVGAKSLQRTNPLQRYYRDVRAGLHNPPMDDMTIHNLALSALDS